CLAPALLGAAVAWWAARRGRFLRASAALAAGMGAVALLLVLLLVPRFEAIKSGRALAAELVARLAPGEVYGIYPRLDNTFLFYTGGRRAEDLDSDAKLRAFVERPGRVWLLAKRDAWAKLSPPIALEEVARDPDPREGYLLLTRP